MINGSEMDVFSISEAELNRFLAQNLKQYSYLEIDSCLEGGAGANDGAEVGNDRQIRNEMI